MTQIDLRYFFQNLCLPNSVLNIDDYKLRMSIEDPLYPSTSNMQSKSHFYVKMDRHIYLIGVRFCVQL